MLIDLRAKKPSCDDRTQRAIILQYSLLFEKLYTRAVRSETTGSLLLLCCFTRLHFEG